MTLPRRLKLVLNFFIGPSLFLIICFSIYKQVIQQPDLSAHWAHIAQVLQNKNIPYWLLAILLMSLNWGLEAWKWHRLAAYVSPISYGMALKSVIAGISFTMLSPNRMGEFLGRVIYLPDNSRLKAATLTILGSLSQLIITFLAGFLGMLALRIWSMDLLQTSNNWSWLLVQILQYGTLALVGISVGLYFNLGWMIRQVEKFPAFSKYASLIHPIGAIGHHELLTLLGISMVRYLLFLAQYMLIFFLFGTGIGIGEMAATTAIMFLILAIIPTIAMAELGVRGKVSLLVFGLFSANSLEILIATATIWFINIIFPAIAGSFLLFSVQLFRKP